MGVGLAATIASPSAAQVGGAVAEEARLAALVPALERDAVSSWARRRVELGLAGAGLDESALLPGALAEAALRLLDEGWLDEELGLLAAGSGSGEREQLRVALAGATGGDLSGGALRQRLIWAALLIRGSALSVLPASCLPTSGTDAIALDAAIAGQLAVPRWRLAAADELAPLPDGPAPVAAALAAAHAWLPASPADASAGTPAPAGACDSAAVALLAALAHADAGEFAALTPAVRALAALGPLPRAPLVRAGVSAYMSADPDALSTLAALLGPDDPDAARVDALRISIVADAAALDAARDALPPASDAFGLWVRGELARRAAHYEAALTDLDAAVDADGFFAAALVSRASALIAAGRAPDALADRAHLERIYPGASPYAVLIEALGRRLR